MRERPYSAAEVAAALGRGAEWFYRHYERLVISEGMPPAMVGFGRRKFDRRSMDAWLGRHHPLAPKPAANDTAPPLAPDNAPAWRSFLAQTYGGTPR